MFIYFNNLSGPKVKKGPTPTPLVGSNPGLKVNTGYFIFLKNPPVPISKEIRLSSLNLK